MKVKRLNIRDNVNGVGKTTKDVWDGNGENVESFSLIYSYIVNNPIKYYKITTMKLYLNEF